MFHFSSVFDTVDHSLKTFPLSFETSISPIFLSPLTTFSSVISFTPPPLCHPPPFFFSFTHLISNSLYGWIHPLSCFQLPPCIVKTHKSASPPPNFQMLLWNNCTRYIVLPLGMSNGKLLSPHANHSYLNICPNHWEWRSSSLPIWRPSSLTPNNSCAIC